MKQQDLGDQTSQDDKPVNRREFLSATAKIAAGAAVAGTLLGTVPSAAFAEKARSIAQVGTASVTLNFVIWSNTAQSVKTWAPVTDLFTKQHPNIKINTMAVPGTDWGTYLEKTLTMIGGGSKLDLTYVAVEGVALMGAKNLALNLNSLIQRDKQELAEFYADSDPALFKTLQYKGQQLELPWSWNNVIMFYNTKVFKQHGIPFPQQGWTANDFLETCAKLKKAGVYGFNVDATSVFQNECWAYAAGGTLLNPTWTKSNVLAPGTVKAFELLHDLVWKYQYAPKGGYNLPSYPLIEAGRAGMFAAGRWPVAVFDQAKFTDYDIQYLPYLGAAKDYKVMIGVDGFPIFKSSAYPEEAWTFAKFMTSKAAMEFWAKQGNNIAARKSIALDPSSMIPPKNFKIYWDSLKMAKPEGCPPQWLAEQTALIATLTQMMSSSASPMAALQSLNTKLNQVLSQPV